MEVTHPQRRVGVGLRTGAEGSFHSFDGVFQNARRSANVVEQARRAGEPLVAHEMFVVEAAGRLAEYGVPFRRQFSERMVVGHGGTPPAFIWIMNAGELVPKKGAFRPSEA